MIGSTLTLVRLWETPLWYLSPSFFLSHLSALHHSLCSFSNFRKCHDGDEISYRSLKGACLCVCVCLREYRHIWASVKTLWYKMAAMNKEWVDFMNKQRSLVHWNDGQIDEPLPTETGSWYAVCIPSVSLSAGESVVSASNWRAAVGGGSTSRPLTQSTLLAGLSLTYPGCQKHHAEGPNSQQLC